MNYSFRAAMFGETSYTEHLKLEAHEALESNIRDFRLDIGTQFAEHSATLSEFAELVGGQLEHINESLDQVVYELSSLNSNIGVLIDVCHWGFEQVIDRLDSIDGVLHQISGTLANPSATWAEEQFNLAQQCYDRALLTESNRYLDFAINGHGSNTGILTVFKYHFLKGLCFLGRPAEDLDPIVDPDAAQNCFLSARRYAESPQQAASAMVFASKAAGVAGQCETSLDHARNAVINDGSLPSAHFAVAKSAFSLNKFDDAVPALSESILLNPVMFFVACNDSDIGANADQRQKSFDNVIEKNREAATKIESELNNLIAAAKSWREFTRSNTDISKATELLKKGRESIKVDSVPATFVGLDLLRKGLQLGRTGLASCEQAANKSLKASWAAANGLIDTKTVSIDSVSVRVNDSRSKHGFKAVQGMRRKIKAIRAGRVTSSLIRVSGKAAGMSLLAGLSARIAMFFLLWLLWHTSMMSEAGAETVGDYVAFFAVIVASFIAWNRGMVWLNGHRPSKDNRSAVPLLLAAVAGGAAVVFADITLSQMVEPIGFHISEIVVGQGVETRADGRKVPYGVADVLKSGQPGIVFVAEYKNASPGKTKLVMRTYRDGARDGGCALLTASTQNGYYSCVFDKPLKPGKYEFRMFKPTDTWLITKKIVVR